MNCRACKVEMVAGKAFMPTASYGLPDFPGSTDSRGQTYSMTGPAVMANVLKCPQCGHSVEAPTNGSNRNG